MTEAKGKYSPRRRLYLGAWRIDADRKGGKNSDIFGIEKEGYHLHRRRTVGGTRVRFGDRSGVGADAGTDRLRGELRLSARRKKPDGNSVAADYVHRRRRDSGFAGKLLKKVYLFPECGYNERMKKAKIFKKRGKST